MTAPIVTLTTVYVAGSDAVRDAILLGINFERRRKQLLSAFFYYVVEVCVAESCVDVVGRVFLVTTTRLSVMVGLCLMLLLGFFVWCVNNNFFGAWWKGKSWLEKMVCAG